MTYRCVLLLLLFLVLAPCLAQAQMKMDGNWLITLTPPGQNPMTLYVQAETVSDTLHLSLLDDHEDAVPLTGIVLEKKQLRFGIPSGHGRIQCTLHKKDEDAFTGICAGPMGEGATTLKRVVKEK